MRCASSVVVSCLLRIRCRRIARSTQPTRGEFAATRVGYPGSGQVQIEPAKRYGIGVCHKLAVARSCARRPPHKSDTIVACILCRGPSDDGQPFESERGVVSEGKYSVELFKEGGEGAGMEEIVDRHDNLTVARAIYRGRVSQYPGRLVMLCDRARVLARSDRPETMP
jgi:hypothetical protein